jgi:general secretion pathway protein J
VARPKAERKTRGRARVRGITLLEVLVSVGILAVVASLVYGAFDGMSRTRQGLGRINDRYHQGRGALSRIARELQTAFISLHQPLVASQSVRATAFIGHDSGSTDRVDFASFSHRRLDRDLHESDQSELAYFASRDPDADKTDLVRREASVIDLEPEKGGIVQVLAEDIQSFELRYLDPLSGEWTDTWDSTQPAAQLGRLPLQVHVTLVLNGGIADKPIPFSTKVPIGMQAPLSFALNIPGAAPASTSSKSGTSGLGGGLGGLGGSRPTIGGGMR